jgi:hypothetical protein
MPFSFLHPWLWLGALAVAVPIWLHLRRRREKNLVRFSAVRFLEDQPVPRRSPWRLRDWFLFALRAAAVLLLAGAFAWPYLGGAPTMPIRESRVYILDNTLSHQAEDGFVRDRQRLVNELRRAETGVQTAVIELTSTPRVGATFGEEREAAIQKVAGLTPSFERGSYLAAFRQANGLLADALGARKRIVLLGDNQQNQWDESVSSPPFLRNVLVDLPEREPAELPSLSLCEPRVQRILLGDRSLVYATVKLHHRGPAKNARVVLRSNGREIFNQTVDLAAQPETVVLQVEWEAGAESWLRGEAEVEGSPDALAGDNRVWFSLPPLNEGTVALLAQSAYLNLALSHEVMRGHWRMRVLEPAALGAEATSANDADVLCMESNYLQSSEARKLLWRYLNNGRGVLLLVNRVTPSVKESLHELGFEVGESVESEPGKTGNFQYVNFNNPILHPFLLPDYGNLMEVGVYKYVRLRPSQALPLIVSGRGDGLFFQGSRFRGRLFVAAFGLDRDFTSWPVHQSFIPFLDLTLQAARAEEPEPSAYEPNEMAVVHLPAPAAAHEVVLRQNGQEMGRAEVQRGRAQIRMPQQPGLYELCADEAREPVRIFSVNPPEKESELAYVQNPEVLEGWKLNRPEGAAEGAVSSVHPALRVDAILQQRIWWWMLMGGLLALALETVLAEAGKERT